MVALGTTSVHLGSGDLVGGACKRHQRSCLVISTALFASRGSPVRSRSRPPYFSFVFIEVTASLPSCFVPPDSGSAQFCAHPDATWLRTRHPRTDEHCEQKS